MKLTNYRGDYPPSEPRSPPPPPPPLDPWAAGATRPSLGCTSTQPWPWKPSWTVSPELFPISDLRFASTFTCGVTLLAHVMAALGSTNVGASVVWSSTGGPSETTATQPVPDSAMLYRPPESAPAIPESSLVMSHSMPASKARTLAPLQVIWSLSSLMRCTS